MNLQEAETRLKELGRAQFICTPNLYLAHRAILEQIEPEEQLKAMSEDLLIEKLKEISRISAMALMPLELLADEMVPVVKTYLDLQAQNKGNGDQSQKGGA